MYNVYIYIYIHIYIYIPTYWCLVDLVWIIISEPLVNRSLPWPSSFAAFVSRFSGRKPDVWRPASRWASSPGTRKTTRKTWENMGKPWKSLGKLVGKSTATIVGSSNSVKAGGFLLSCPWNQSFGKFEQRCWNAWSSPDGRVQNKQDPKVNWVTN